MNDAHSNFSDQDDDEDEEHSTLDLRSLSSMLSPDTYAALHSHLMGSDAPKQTVLKVESFAKESYAKLSSEVIPATNNAVFKDQSYWEDRFAQEQEYDWLLTFDQLQTHLIPLLHVGERILIVGCGNSGLSAGLYDAGFTNITNIDFSETVIERMKEAHLATRPFMQWITMDMTEMHFEPSSFDVVIDKASMDALMVDEGDVWDPKQSTIEVTDRMNKGISKILKPRTGRFIQLSFAQPHFRTKYLMGIHMKKGITTENSVSQYTSCTGYCERYGWTLSFSTIDTEAGCLNSFLYVMKLE